MIRLDSRLCGALVACVLLSGAATAQTTPAAEPTSATETQAATPAPPPAAETPAPVTTAAVERPVPPAPPPIPVTKLRWGTINQANQAAFKGILVPLVATLEQQSEGRLKIELGTLNQFGKPGELLPKVESGELDMATTVQGYHPGRFPRSEVMELPMMFPNSVVGSEAIWQLLEDGSIAEDYKNLKVLALYVLPPYGIHFADHQVKSPRDLRGVSVRAPSAIIGLAFDRLGMVPLGLPFNVSGQYVAEGMLDSVSLTWDTVQSTKVTDEKTLVSYIKQGLDLRFAAPAQVVLMNKQRYESLPADLRALLDKHTGRGLVQLMAQQRDDADDAAREQFRATAGKQIFELTQEQRKDVAEYVEPVVAHWAGEMQAKGIDGKTLVAHARALVAATAKR